jgi:hypothetical protein
MRCYCVFLWSLTGAQKYKNRLTIASSRRSYLARLKLTLGKSKPMKLLIYCPICINETDLAAAAVDVEPTDDGRYAISCPKGHRIDMSVGYHTFQILFEIGINAIIDGYYREAIGSFTASYERFLEFFVKLVSLSQGIEEQDLEKCWKNVSNQSERQLGAYIFQHLHTYKKPPQILSTKDVALRNMVIHKGHIPTKLECIEYGNAVLSLIRNDISELWSSHNRELIGSVNNRWFGGQENQPTIFFLPWMTLGTNRPPTDARKLEDIIDQMEGATKPA